MEENKTHKNPAPRSNKTNKAQNAHKRSESHEKEQAVNKDTAVKAGKKSSQKKHGHAPACLHWVKCDKDGRPAISIHIKKPFIEGLMKGPDFGMRCYLSEANLRDAGFVPAKEFGQNINISEDAVKEVKKEAISK